MDQFKKPSAYFMQSKVLKALVCIFSSFYLMIYVNLYMLDSIWLCLPVFGCAFAIGRIFLRTASRFFQSAPQPEAAFLSITVVVMIFTEGWHVFFPSGSAWSPMGVLLYVFWFLSMIGFLCLCCSYALFGEKGEQWKSDEKMEEVLETVEINRAQRDIYKL